MKIKLFSFVFLLVCIATSCAQAVKSEITLFDEDQLLVHLEELSSDKYQGRRTGTRGNDSARAYIIKQFKDLKIKGFNENYEQPFSFQLRNKSIQGVNVLAEIKGTEKPDKYIVISAYYDHLGTRKDVVYNGADDDASGVSALFSFAEYFTKNPPKHSVILAAFDAEEIGLQGAKHLVSTIDNDNVLLNLNMDMISRSDKNELYVVGGTYNQSLNSTIENFDNPTSTKLIQGHDGTDGKQNWTMSSDHAPLHLAKIPFLYFGNEDHTSYHKPTDDFKDINPQFYINATKIILSMFLTIDNSGL
ncbi:M28 family peptidase [Winogradskyella sp.]|uniref:M28 family peptidase n=1 Tax=Winogradskyella sp. TaxID=1883156 RepID=UPI003F6D413B